MVTLPRVRHGQNQGFCPAYVKNNKSPPIRTFQIIRIIQIIPSVRIGVLSRGGGAVYFGGGGPPVVLGSGRGSLKLLRWMWMVEAFVRSVRCGFRGVGAVSRVFAILNIFGSGQMDRVKQMGPLSLIL